MNIVTKIFATVAALIHILFFCLESLFWHTPKVQKIFKMPSGSLEVTSLLAFNQGFYNLFLAAGALLGLLLYAKGKKSVGITLVAYTNTCMFAAAIVLLASASEMLTGSLVQGVPPLVVLISLLYIQNQDLFDIANSSS